MSIVSVRLALVRFAKERSAFTQVGFAQVGIAEINPPETNSSIIADLSSFSKLAEKYPLLRSPAENFLARVSRSKHQRLQGAIRYVFGLP